MVDADQQIVGILRDILETENYHVTAACDGQEMLGALAAQSFDLITLDLGLSGISGVELARELCLSTDIPIIVVSARSEDYDRIGALEFGADDYIVKPFNGRELAARVRAVLRRSASPARRNGQAHAIASPEITFHDYQLNMQTRRLRQSDGATTELTTAECKLLEVSIANAGRACTRDEITARIKGRTWSPLDRSLDTLVARLRRKIEPDPDQPSVLMSVRGVGFLMTV